MRYYRAHKEPIGVVEASTFTVIPMNRGTLEDCCNYLDGGERSVSGVQKMLIKGLKLTTTIPQLIIRATKAQMTNRNGRPLLLKMRQ